MADPSHRGTTSAVFSGTTSVSVPFPSGTVADDYAVVLVATRKTPPAVSAPAGWSTLKGETTVGSDVAGTLFGKQLDAADISAGAATFTITPSDGGAYICTTAPNVDSTTSPAELTTSSASSTATAPAISGVGQASGDLALFFVVGEEGGGNVSASSPSLGTLRASPSATGSKRPVVGLSTYPMTSPSATANVTFSMSEAVTSFGLSLLLKTADGAGGGEGTITLPGIGVGVTVPAPIIQTGGSGGGSGGSGGTPAVLDPNASGFTDFVGCRVSSVFTATKEGTITTTSNGQVISERRCGHIRVKHTNVTIRDCVIEGTSNNMIQNDAGTNANLRVEWCTGVGSEPSSNFIGYNGYHLYRCDMSGSADGAKINGNCTVEECWIHDLGRWRISSGGLTHNDCLQSTGAGNSSNITIVRSLLQQDWRTTSIIKITSERGDVGQNGPVLIEGNRFLPAGEVNGTEWDGSSNDTRINIGIYLTKKGSFTAPRNVTIRNNTFVDNFRLGLYNIDNSAQVTRTGNVLSDGSLIGGQQGGGEDPGPQPVDLTFTALPIPIVLEGMSITTDDPPPLPDVEVTLGAIGVGVTVPGDMEITRETVVVNPPEEGDEGGEEPQETLDRPQRVRRARGLEGYVRRRWAEPDAGVRSTPLGGRYRTGGSG